MHIQWWIILGTLFWLTLVFMVGLTTSPGLMVGSFLLAVWGSVYCLFNFLTDLWAYYLFLIYIGGLLVLLSYMIMLSSNQIFDSSSQIWMASGCIVVLMVSYYFTKGSVSWFNLPLSSCIIKMEFSCLLMLGLLLLYIFMSVCNVIMVGGRALKF